jgi:hypothetical protein
LRAKRAAKEFCRPVETTLASGTMTPVSGLSYHDAGHRRVAARHRSNGAGNYSGVGGANCMSAETTIEVEHCFREAGAGGSNPLTPTSIFLIRSIA